LNAAAVIIIIDRVEAWFSDKPRMGVLTRCAILLWGALFVFNSLFLDSAGLAYGVWGRWESKHIPGSSFSEPRLVGFTSFDTDYVNFVNDGLALAQRCRRPGDTIVSLDFSNPFSYAFGTRPAWGGTSTGLQFDTNFDDTHRIAPERLFGHAALLMVPQPRRFSDPTLADNLPRVYGPYIQQHFHLIGETDLWRAYRSNDQ
jgi:hypothetical protein